MLTQAPRGTRDILPDEANNWVYLESKFRDICRRFNYKEIRTPVFEHTELFQRGIGETTDIVEKEMYTFLDKSNRSITLKPEGTAPVARAYIEHKMYSLPLPMKLYYIIPGFRYERPQAGRLRQFHQFGIESFGSQSPRIDAEVMLLAMMFFKELGLDDIDLHINSIGCERCRNNYKQALKAFLTQKKEMFCETCRSRLERNPLRVFDCKNERCQQIINDTPIVLDYLCDECKVHFNKVENTLTTIGVNYIVDSRLVRGLDYYTKTVFEIVSTELGAQSAICGGGRYDNLVKECGGPETPAVGFGMGVERLINVLENKSLLKIQDQNIDVFVVLLDKEYEQVGTKLLYELREKGISAEIDYLDRSLRAQMKCADKLSAKYAVLIGAEEVESRFFTIKDLSKGSQESISFESIYDYLSNHLKEGFSL
ncbi:MAG: histidine--tRNA ligase [Thermoanaerobacterales bacterium]|nr:histidine--tRNA ligase [Thermoanaerobacterales bacterium]